LHSKPSRVRCNVGPWSRANLKNNWSTWWGTGGQHLQQEWEEQSNGSNSLIIILGGETWA